VHDVILRHFSSIFPLLFCISDKNFFLH
jgi:hypothetical protein